MGFRLTWQDNNASEDGHRIYRSTTPMDPEDLPAPLATIGAGVTTWDDTTAAEGVTYYYRVSAFKGDAEAVSSEVEGVPGGGPEPTIGYADLILTKALFGYWRLGETSGTTAADTSLNGRNGSFAGTYSLNRPSLIPSDLVNAAFGCNGTGYINVPLATTIPVAGKTLLFSLKMNSLTPASYICHLGSYGLAGVRGVAPFINTDGSLSIEFYDGNFRYINFPGFAASLNTAYRVAMRFNSNQSVSLFVNGTLISTQTTTFNLNAEPGNHIRLGAGSSSGETSVAILRGDLDEVAIINALLSDAEIAELETAALG